MKHNIELQKLPSEESHSMTDCLRENSANHLKKHEKRVVNLIKYNNNKHNMLVLYKRWKKHNEIQLTKNKMDLTVAEPGDEPITT